MTEANVVWWALILGGLIGGFARSLVGLRIEFPYVMRDQITRQIVVVPGTLGDLLLGPVAALVLAGAGAATFQFQSEYDARGFWGPLISSIVAGVASTQILQDRAKQVLADLQQNLLAEAEKQI